MRNILQYPITDEEVIEVLQRLQEDIAKENTVEMVVGDMRPLVLGYAIERFKEILSSKDKANL